MFDDQMNAEPLGLRERKKLQTRRAIRKVALELALTTGVEKLTVEAIADAVGISPRTFFNYFETKEDALISGFPAAVSTLKPLLKNRDASEHPLRSLIAVIEEEDPFSLSEADRGMMLSRQQLIQQHPNLMGRQLAKHALMERELAEMLAQRYGVDVDEDLRPALLAGVVLSAMRIALRRWTKDGSRPLKDLIDEAFHLLEKGFLQQKDVTGDE